MTGALWCMFMSWQSYSQNAMQLDYQYSSKWHCARSMKSPAKLARNARSLQLNHRWAIIRSSFCAPSCIQVFKYLYARCFAFLDYCRYERARTLEAAFRFMFFILCWHSDICWLSLRRPSQSQHERKPFCPYAMALFNSCAFDRMNNQTGQSVG